MVAHPDWRDARERILAALAGSRRWIAILGPSGTGKTLLLRDVSRALEGGARRSVSASALADISALALEMTPGGASLIDDADELGETTLAVLATAGVRRVFAGSPALADRLLGHVPDTEIVPLLTLAPNDARVFLALWMAHGGLEPKLLARDAAAELIASAAGVPRALEALAGLSVRNATSERARRVTPRHVRLAAAALAGTDDAGHRGTVRRGWRMRSAVARGGRHMRRAVRGIAIGGAMAGIVAAAGLVWAIVGVATPPDDVIAATAVSPAAPPPSVAPPGPAAPELSRAASLPLADQRQPDIAPTGTADVAALRPPATRPPNRAGSATSRLAHVSAVAEVAHAVAPPRAGEPPAGAIPPRAAAVAQNPASISVAAASTPPPSAIAPVAQTSFPAVPPGPTAPQYSVPVLLALVAPAALRHSDALVPSPPVPYPREPPSRSPAVHAAPAPSAAEPPALPTRFAVARDLAPALPLPEIRSATAPGLLLVARANETLGSLYRKVYQGLTPPPYSVVAELNPEHVRPGDVLTFPAPAEGWARQRTALRAPADP